MNSSQNRSSIATLLFVASTMLVPIDACGEELADSVKTVQGKWVRHQATPAGPIKIIKEHKGNSTVLTAYDENANVLYAHESEFKIEQTGKVQVFTFANRTITAGPQAGQKFKDPASFIFRVTENRFIEVHGVLEGDTNAPNMVIWERVNGQDNAGRQTAPVLPSSKHRLLAVGTNPYFCPVTRNAAAPTGSMVTEWANRWT